MFCNMRLQQCWTRERWTGAGVYVRVQTQQAIGHWEKDKERQQAQIKLSEREGKWWGSPRSWTRVAVLLISRWQSLYCTWKVKIIFRQIEFDISDEIFLTSFPELTETCSGGRGAWLYELMPVEASLSLQPHVQLLLCWSTHEMGQFPIFATKFPLTLRIF